MGWFKLWAPSGAFDSRSYGKADCASSIVTPTADVEEIAVPGKNGTVLIPQNRWNNVDRTFSMFISLSDWSTVVGKLQECSSGYYTLEDSWNTGYFYMARLQSCELVNSTPALAHGVVEIVFDCQPIRWETTGAQWAAQSSLPVTLHNSSPLLSMPIALRAKPQNPQSSGDNFKVQLTVSYYPGDPEQQLNDSGVMTIIANYPAGGNLIIDTLTHDISCDNIYAIDPEGYEVPPSSVLQYVSISKSSYFVPAINWPVIPSGWWAVIDAENLISGQTLSLDIKARGCAI